MRLEIIEDLLLFIAALLGALAADHWQLLALTIACLTLSGAFFGLLFIDLWRNRNAR